MARLFANVDSTGHVYYPTEMFSFFDRFPYVARIDTKQMRVQNNADKIRAKLLEKDVLIYPLKGVQNQWEIRFKTENAQTQFIKQYRGG